MMKLMRKVLACTLVLMLVLGSVSCAMAGTYPSNAFRLPSVQARPTESAGPEETEAPADTGEPVETEAPAETETPVETEAPAETEEPVETEAPAETGEPVETEAPAENGEPVESETPAETEEPVETEEPTEEEELRYTFVRDGEGNLMLDSQGNPIIIVPDGLEVPVAYMRDENGNLILDENGDPIAKETLPAGTDKLTSIYDLLDPNRRIDIYVTWNGEKAFGTSITMSAVLIGYDQVSFQLQWQTSSDNATWRDVDMAAGSQYTVVMTQDNYLDYWRVVVIMDEEQ